MTQRRPTPFPPSGADDSGSDDFGWEPAGPVPADAGAVVFDEHRGDAPASLRWGLAVLIAVLLVSTAASYLSRDVAAPLGADAPADVFSAERAARTVSPMVAEPRPIGSAANDEAHELLAAQLDELGFSVETHEAIGTGPARTDAAAAGFTRNLVATRPGSDATGTIVLATHIDSVPNAPGAADAGVGLAVILEAVRALGPEVQRNDLVVLLVDGEENGLLGADAFIRERAGELAEPVVVINHEARGVSGVPLVARTSGPMHRVLGSMPQPEFESLSDAIFELVPNDTDFTVYREAGWWGMDVAITGDSWAYHSPQDDAAHLDPGSLQHFGDLTLALTRDLTDRDLRVLEAAVGEEPVQTSAPWGIVRLPPVAIAVLGAAAPVAVLGVLVLRRRRGQLTVRGAVGAALAAIIALAAGVVASFGLWQAAAGARPEMVSATMGEPVRAGLFFAAELAAAAAVAAAVWVLLRLGLSRAAITTGAALAGTGLLAALAIYSPSLGSPMVLPAVAAALGALLGALLRGPAGLVVRALALLPTGWLIGTQLSGGVEFGIASSAGTMAGTVLVALAAAAALFTGPTDPARPVERRARRLLVPAGIAILAVGLTAAGVQYTLAAPEPVQERVVAHVDAETGETRWETQGRTDWGAQLDGSAATSELEAPRVELTDLSEQEPGRVRLVVSSPRGAGQITLELEDGQAHRPTIDGLSWGGGHGVTRMGVVGLQAGQEVVIEATIEGATELMVTDMSHDPSEAGGWVDPGDEVSLVESAVRVSTTIGL